MPAQIYVLPKSTPLCQLSRMPPGSPVLDVTSHSQTIFRQLSPFLLGPVPLYRGFVAKNVENAYQFCKVYPQHVGRDGEPTDEYFRWANEGWRKQRAVRYPMGRNRGSTVCYSYFSGAHLGYIHARKMLYIPWYANLAVRTDAYRTLLDLHAHAPAIALLDFDGYDRRQLGMTLYDVVHSPSRTMGHAFVLELMLEGQQAWEHALGPAASPA